MSYLIKMDLCPSSTDFGSHLPAVVTKTLAKQSLKKNPSSVSGAKPLFKVVYNSPVCSDVKC